MTSPINTIAFSIRRPNIIGLPRGIRQVINPEAQSKNDAAIFDGGASHKTDVNPIMDHCRLYGFKVYDAFWHEERDDEGRKYALITFVMAPAKEHAVRDLETRLFLYFMVCFNFWSCQVFEKEPGKIKISLWNRQKIEYVTTEDNPEPHLEQPKNRLKIRNGALEMTANRWHNC